MPTYNDQLQAQLNLWQIMLTRWSAESFLSFSWWLLAGLIVVAYAIWLKVVDKKSLRNILLFGSFVAVMNTAMDLSLSAMGLWGYKTKLIPTIPSLFPIDYTVVPLMVMLVYQFFPTWGRYFIAIAVVKGIFVFAVIPLMVSLQIMAIHGISLNYVYAGTVVIPLIAKFVIEAVIRVEHAAEARTDTNTRKWVTVAPAPATRREDDTNE